MKSKRPDWLRHLLRLRRSKGPTTDVGMCLRETREVLGAGPGAPDAIAAWNAAEHKHRVPASGPARDKFIRSIPPGVPLFWSGGSKGHGHAGVSAFKRRWCWSVDKLRPGFWDRTSIDSISRDWRLTFLGWTEDINGHRVYRERG